MFQVARLALRSSCSTSLTSLSKKYSAPDWRAFSNFGVRLEMADLIEVYMRVFGADMMTDIKE
jgi:hypothetical protein